MKENFRYHAEDEELQTVRTASAIVATGQAKGLDCKNYSLFTAGVTEALNRMYYSIPWCFRFAAYPKGGFPNRYLRHVFVVFYPGTDEELWIDPVLDSFNSREKIPCYKKDMQPMLGKLSGVYGGASIGQDGSDYIDYSQFATPTDSCTDVTDPNCPNYDATQDPLSPYYGMTQAGAAAMEAQDSAVNVSNPDSPNYDPSSPDYNPALDSNSSSYDPTKDPNSAYYNMTQAQLKAAEAPYYASSTPPAGATPPYVPPKSGGSSASSGNFLDNLVKQFTTPKTPTTPAGTTYPPGTAAAGTPRYVYAPAPAPASAGMSTNTLLLIGAVVVGGLVLFMVNRK